MSDEEEDIEIEGPDSIYLGDDTCWVYDPQYLDPDTEFDGVLAVQYRAGELFYLDGKKRKWVNAEKQSRGDAKLRTVQ